MPSPLSWDLFCRVIDNYGDAGVCWRLARQLARTQGVSVRLWIDDLASLRMLVPEADTALAAQTLEGIAVQRWLPQWTPVTPGEVCVEAFGCGLPDAYKEAMAARRPRTLWIVLEYLSAEPWVRGHHALASPPPRLELERYFYFPGFERGTGGLLREPGLLERRDAWGAAQRARYWSGLGCEPPRPSATVVSIFAYPYAPLAPLLDYWARSANEWVVAIPEGRLAAAAAQWFGLDGAPPGTSVRRGSVELRVLPFVPQVRYDELLWSCDCNFVRGEDSFVRGLWAGAPCVWHIYPQEQRAHWRKLDAFLDIYCAGLPEAVGTAVRGMWRAWNQVEPAPVTVPAAWERFWAGRDRLDAHARDWAGRLVEGGELAENLAEFCRDKLK